MKYTDLESKPNFEKIQPEILNFWEQNKIFEQSVKKNEGKEVTFYDGPPFPTGKPHHGTVLVSFIKDMISRYWTMNGYSVPRVWGWDCHGLPIENQAEGLLGIDNKNQIEKEIGIANFNDKCYEIVSSNNEAWKEYVTQMARWVDYDGAYKTMQPQFMESVLWAFKTCYDKGLIYRDYRVTPYCTHCETSLSISDTRESDSTRPRQDRWIIVKFKTSQVIDGKTVFLTAWTTTPWTLPSNMCLAVGKDLDYAFVAVNDEILVACKNTLANFKNVFGEEPNIIKVVKGSDLVGIEYEPIFDYFIENKERGAFKVVIADYVGADEGVGIVHTAPAFGEDDYWTCKHNSIPLVNPVDAKGQFTEEIKDFYPIQEDKTVIEMNPIIIKFLYNKSIAVADGTVEHNYPHCWRCKRPLIYKAMDAYYFNIEKIKPRLLEMNEKVNWIPETVKHGRFGNWLDGARDWNISRNRYWSTPIPIWHCDCCDNKVVLGSVAEIEAKSGVHLDNLHRQFMDKVTFKCDKCGGTMTRVPEVLDCWFESGSVPFASKHYPFENKEWFETHFPSDFVVEYTGQIRCWFYYLHVLGVALFDRPAYKNCIVHGTILAKDGKKLSKSSKNYTDPMELMKKYGTDAFRLYLYQTKAMLIGDLLFDEAGIVDAYQQLILPYWNACNFFISYAKIDNVEVDENILPQTDNELDKWILAKLYDTSKQITNAMNNYQVDSYVGNMFSLIDGLTNWYIRRSRRRFWASGMSQDKKSAYQTLYYVLTNIAKLLAPVAPIVSEKVYKALTGGYSVHLTDWTVIPETFKNEKLLKEIDVAQDIIYLARSVRNKCKIKNRQPLKLLKVASPSVETLEIAKQFADIIKEELNVKDIEFLDNVSEIADIKYAPHFANIKEKCPDLVPQVIKAINQKAYKFVCDKVELQLENETLVVDADVILVSYTALDGLFVASDNMAVVSLDTTLTEELKTEGIAREIIRSVQDARKQMDCVITDRINLEIETQFDENWKQVIAKETLADFVEIQNPTLTLDVETDNGIIKVLVQKKN